MPWSCGIAQPSHADMRLTRHYTSTDAPSENSRQLRWDKTRRSLRKLALEGEKMATRMWSRAG
jgi:hypothetical protein